MAVLERYKYVPIDLADASIVAAAERFSACRVFAIDSDFYIYRLVDGSALELAQ